MILRCIYYLRIAGLYHLECHVSSGSLPGYRLSDSLDTQYLQELRDSRLSAQVGPAAARAAWHRQDLASEGKSLRNCLSNFSIVLPLVSPLF